MLAEPRFIIRVLLFSQCHQRDQDSPHRASASTQSSSSIRRFRLSGSTVRLRRGGTGRLGRTRRRSALANNLVGDGDSLRRADALCVLYGSIFASLVAGVFEATRDAVEESIVGADALDVELLTASDLVASGVFRDARLLWRCESAM